MQTKKTRQSRGSGSKKDRFESGAREERRREGKGRQSERGGKRARFDFRDEFGEEAVGCSDVLRVAVAAEEEALEDELVEQQAHDLAEVHAADHLLVQLAACTRTRPMRSKRSTTLY